MGKKNEYVIGFSGLKDGHHFFSHKIGDKFFEQLDYSEIEKANLTVEVDFEKKETMLILNLKIEGEVNVMCDKCTDNFNFPIKGEDEVIYKFTEEEMLDEKVKCVLPHETEIDITHPIYEFTNLLLPSRKVHPEDECNQEMLNELDNYLMIEEVEEGEEDDQEDTNEVDPRWAALNKLKKK